MVAHACGTAGWLLACGCLGSSSDFSLLSDSAFRNMRGDNICERYLDHGAKQMVSQSVSQQASQPVGRTSEQHDHALLIVT